MNRARGGYNHRRGAKQIVRDRNRFARLDADIASAYDDEDDSGVQPVRISPASLRPGMGVRGVVQLPLRISERRDRFIEQSGMRNAEIVYRIKVPYGARKFSSQWVIRQLNRKIENLKPLMVSETQKGDIEFYVKDSDTSSAIQSVSRRIVHGNGDRVEFICNRVTAPWTRLQPSETKVIQAVIDKRYNSETRALDLSFFGDDELFKQNDLLMWLTKNNVMLAVVDYIDEKYGNLIALSLSNNNIRYLDYAQSLSSIVKFLKVLDLSHNKDGKPVQPISAPLAEADINEQFPIRAGFYGDAEVRSVVENFLISYFNIYDGEEGGITRKELIKAYDEHNSTFTLCISNLKDVQTIRYHDDNCYGTYARQSHNIFMEDKFSRNRSSRVVKGAMDIAVALGKLPITNHLKETFVCDVFFSADNLLGFALQGLFEDGILARGNEMPKLQFFTRTFIVEGRAGGTLAVISDQLFISGLLPERMARYKILLDKGNANGSATASDSLNPMMAAVQGCDDMAGDIDSMRQGMVEAFCKLSGMLPAWSRKCLEDCQWDFAKAEASFVNFKDRIPLEAFGVAR